MVDVAEVVEGVVEVAVEVVEAADCLALAVVAVAAAAAAVLAVQPTSSIQPLPLVMLHRRPLANLREPQEASTPRPPAAERETLPLWKASEERVPQRGDAR